LTVAEKYAGRRVQCPKCQSAFVLPQSNGSLEAPRIVVVGTSPSNDPQPPPLPTIAGSFEASSIVLTTNVRAATAVQNAATTEIAAPAVPSVFESPHRIHGYRADPARTRVVYLLALGIVALVFFQLVPIWSRSNPATAPNWARWVMMLAVVQFAFAVWMASLPDWSTVRITMFALAGVATVYCAALGIATLTPVTQPLMFDMDDIREKVRLWCMAVTLLVCLMIYLCGRVAFRWRKAYELPEFAAPFKNSNS
jgi:hypothetical protein